MIKFGLSLAVWKYDSENPVLLPKILCHVVLVGNR